MENEGQSWSEESRNASSESECESETSAVYWWVGRRDNGQKETQGIHVY
jgi:hypothetical protein